MFSIRISTVFSAAHALRLPDGSLEPLHGHNWRVEVQVEADDLDAMGTVMDFHQLESSLQAVVAPMHNANLNDLPEFSERNPSAELVALTIAERLVLPEHVRLGRVRVEEAAGCQATYIPGRPPADPR
ncbi:MAG: 6-pyruvoyl tetrahydropterin synthase family protein [Phycisphaerae bacterium]